MQTRKKHTTAFIAKDLKVDPLLVGSDRTFLETFPKAAIFAAGALPLRRYGTLGLIATRSERDSGPSLSRLQKETDVRLIAVPSMNEYGIELFLRYWEGAPKKPTPGQPAIWMAEERRGYLKRLGELASIHGRAHPIALAASLILTSPLNNECPVVMVRLGDETQVLFLGGAGGLRIGLRFPGAWHEDLLKRIKMEFGMEGKAMEGRGTEDRGLNDLTALALPPLKTETLILEPRGRR